MRLKQLHRTAFSTCLGKVGYTTAARAKQVIREMDKAPGRKYLKPYRCPWCVLWHIGNKKRGSRVWR